MSNNVTIESALLRCEPEIVNFVAALKAENLKCQKHVAKLQAQNVSLKNSIAIAEKQLKEFERIHGMTQNEIQDELTSLDAAMKKRHDDES